MRLKVTIAAGVILIIFAIFAGIFLKDWKNKNNNKNNTGIEETSKNISPGGKK